MKMESITALFEPLHVLFESLAEYFSTLNMDSLLADFSVILDGINIDLIKETFQSLVDTISALFA